MKTHFILLGMLLWVFELLARDTVDLIKVNNSSQDKPQMEQPALGKPLVQPQGNEEAFNKSSRQQQLNPDGTLDLSSGFNGSLDPSGFRMVSGWDGEPRFLMEQSDGFNNLGHFQDKMRDEGDENWQAFQTVNGVNGTVCAIAISGSDVYVGGEFTEAGGISANRIVKWNGSFWEPLGSGVNGTVYAIAVFGSNVYVGGSFTEAGGASAMRIAKYNGTSWSALGSGVNDIVSAIAISGSAVYLGGYFTQAGGITVNYIAKWDGMSWTALGSGVNGFVRAIAVSASEVYVGGAFTEAGGVSANYIAKWDGTSWSALSNGIYKGVNGTILTIAISGSDAYVGGSFTQADGIGLNIIIVNNIARWDGSRWSALGDGVNSSVRGIAVSGSDVYVGGEFTEAEVVSANYTAKWDGTSWSALGSGVNDIVSAIAVSDNELYVGGEFTQVGGSSANHFARWNGNFWSVTGTQGINGVLIDANGRPVSTPTEIVLILVQESYQNYETFTQNTEEGTGAFYFKPPYYWSGFSRVHVVLKTSNGFSVGTWFSYDESVAMNLHESSLSMYGNPDVESLENIWDALFPENILPYTANAAQNYFWISTLIDLKIHQDTELSAADISSVGLFVEPGGKITCNNLNIRGDLNNAGEITAETLAFIGGNYSTASINNFIIGNLQVNKSGGSNVTILDDEFIVLGNTTIAGGGLSLRGNAGFLGEVAIGATGHLFFDGDATFEQSVAIAEGGSFEMINLTEAQQIEFLTGVDVSGNLRIVGSGHELVFGAGSSSIIRESGHIWIEGEFSDYINISSTQDGVQWNLRFDPPATVVVKLARIKDSNASAGNSVQAILSDNHGNNDNWHFILSFNTTWDTSLGDGTTVTLALAGEVDASIFWREGVITQVTDPGPHIHDYGVNGIYTVAVFGTATAYNSLINGGDSGERAKLISVDSWGDLGFTNLDYGFSHATNLQFVPNNTNGIENVTSMAGMFQYVSVFNGDIANWNTGNVTDMSSMFEGCISFNQDIGGWHTANVINMENMFYGATSFNQNIGGWDISNTTSMADMFRNLSLSTPNYNALLTGWAAQEVQSNIVFHGGNSMYSGGGAITARATLTGDPNNWTITDGGLLTSIIAQPEGGTICEGGEHTFKVVAEGADLSYQWKKGVENVGENSPTMKISNSQESDAGQYSIVVTGLGGVATSNFVELFVDPATVGGSLSGLVTITYGSSTGTLTLTGHTGAIQKWQRKYESEGWEDISNTGTTHIETPTSVGEWYYRVEMKSGVCIVDYTSEFEVNVQPKELTITGAFTVYDKTYDGTADAEIENNNLFLAGGIDDDDVQIDNISVEFSQSDIGDNITVLITDAALVGEDRDNYTLTLEGAPTATASIVMATSIDLLMTGNFLVYPNPLFDYIYLKNAENVVKITLTNLSGQKVLIRYLEGEKRISTQSLTRGIYFLTVEYDNNKVQVIKMLKK